MDTTTGEYTSPTEGQATYPHIRDSLAYLSGEEIMMQNGRSRLSGEFLGRQTPRNITTRPGFEHLNVLERPIKSHVIEKTSTSAQGLGTLTGSITVLVKPQRHRVNLQGVQRYYPHVTDVYISEGLHDYRGLEVSQYPCMRSFKQGSLGDILRSLPDDIWAEEVAGVMLPPPEDHTQQEWCSENGVVINQVRIWNVPTYLTWQRESGGRPRAKGLTEITITRRLRLAVPEPVESELDPI